MITLPSDPAPISNFEKAPEVFLRLETYADVYDCVLLLGSGANISFEGITGSISGFARPTCTTITRKVSFGRGMLGRRSETILVQDTPQSIASAIRLLMETKEVRSELIVDCSMVEPGARSKVVADAFTGLCLLMNYRAERLFSKTDLVDLMGWIGQMFPARLDATICFGDAEWGDFVKREPFGHLVENHPAPAQDRHTRTLTFWSRPDSYDLQCVLSHMSKSGLPISLVNGAAAAQRFPAFRGMSTDKALLMANHTICHPLAVDVSGLAETGAWEAARAAGAAGYRLSGKALDERLQPIWTQQRTFHRPVGVYLAGAPHAGAFRNCRNHCLEASFKAAQDADGALTFGAAALDLGPLHGGACQSLSQQAAWAKMCDHNAAATIVVGDFETAAVVDWLRANFDSFIGATFKPLR